ILNSHGGVNTTLMYVSDVLSMYPGDMDVMVYLPGGRSVRADAEHRVDGSEEFMNRLEKLFGSENVKGGRSSS
ncbi:MAG: hypothetical protein MJ127_02150, partial [Mogibacterium sp.]|nr:hypothetical protein [Mogibacterium sp.]